MIDQDKMRALAEKLREDYRNSIKVLPWPYRSAISSTPMEAADAIDLLLAELEAAAADKLDADRYRSIRRLNAQQFAELFQRNIREGIQFDFLVDQLQIGGYVTLDQAFANAALAQRQGEG
ncbi:TPA: hypothetical protein QDA71_006689, partial [Burkholderia vietnamiensis]|nr:hypothetical protein [Burkholderia vietnamiensis]